MQGSLMGRRLDLLQLSRHHVFSDMILAQLPLEALGRLQTTCTRLQSHIKDLPEAIWVQAARSQLPACHPVFSSLQTVQEYLRFHFKVHEAFSPSQTPAALAQSASVSWAKGMTASPDLSKAAHITGQQVILTDLTTAQSLGAYPLPVHLRGRRWAQIVFSPTGKHLCIQLCQAYVELGTHGPDPVCYYIMDLETGTVVASQGPHGGSWFCSWAPNGRQFLVQASCTGSVDEFEFARVHDTSCSCIAEAQLPRRWEYRAWAPDSTAVVMKQACVDEFQLWNLSGESKGVRHGVVPPQPTIAEFHWSPDSTLLYCTMFQSKQLLCYDRQAVLVQSCMLSCPASMLLGLSMQPRVGAATAVTMRCCSYISPFTDIRVYSIGLGCSPAALFNLPRLNNCSPSQLCLSPDGTYLAFNLRSYGANSSLSLSTASASRAESVLHVCSIRTRFVRVLKLNFILRSLQWTADGAGIFLLGWGQGMICRLV